MKIKQKNKDLLIKMGYSFKWDPINFKKTSIKIRKMIGEGDEEDAIVYSKYSPPREGSFRYDLLPQNRKKIDMKNFEYLDKIIAFHKKYNIENNIMIYGKEEEFEKLLDSVEVHPELHFDSLVIDDKTENVKSILYRGFIFHLVHI